MNKVLALSVFLAAGTSVAVAAPQEFIEFTNVASNNRIAQVTTVNNVVQTWTAVGGYPVRHIQVEGEIARDLAGGMDSWFGEACIFVTPPVGTPFVIQPIVGGNPGSTVTGGAIASGVFAIPVSTVADAAGNWSFEFFEMWDDNETNTALGGAAAAATLTSQTDATWTRIRFTLDDADPAAFNPPLPAGTTSFATLAASNQPSNLADLLTAPNFTASIGAGANIIGWQAFGRVTAVGAAGGANQAGSLTDDAVVRVVPPGLALDTTQVGGALPVLGNSTSTADGNIAIAYTGSFPSAGSWTVVTSEATDTLGTPINPVDNVWNQLTVRLIDSIGTPTATADLGTLVAGTPATANFQITSPGQTAWVKFTVPFAIRWPNQAALRIDTEGSDTVLGTSVTAATRRNTSISLFRNDGVRVAADFADGSDSNGQLTFGYDNLPGAAFLPGTGITGSANGARYNGRDGFLDAGTYWLGVSAGDAGLTVGPGFFAVNNPATNTTVSTGGGIVVNVGLFNPAPQASNAANAPATPGAQNFGLIGVPNGDGTTEDVNTATVNYDAGTSTLLPLNVQWFQFKTGRDASVASGFYVDLDTAGTAVGEVANPANPLVPLIDANDTEMAIYSGLGNLIAKNDDFDANAADTDFVVTSGLSFGRTANPRAYPLAGGTAFAGQGGVLPAGTYFVAGTMWNVVFGLNDPADANVATSTRATDGTRSDTNFQVERRTVTGAITPAGTLTVNVRTNMPLACGLSDIAGPGPSEGADGELTADDIIFFIAGFTGGIFTRSDIAAPGPTPGADGELTADDVILFITRFTAGC
jgi:hypothetical protein